MKSYTVFKKITLGLTIIASMSSVLAVMPASAQPTGVDAIDRDMKNSQKISMLSSNIPWFRGADFAEFNRTISQTRDGVRKEFSSELMDMIMPMLEAGADASAILEPLTNILLTFDKLHKEQINDASANLGRSLEAMFSSEFDNLYRVYDIKQDERKAMFAFPQDLNSVIAAKVFNIPLTADQQNYVASHSPFLAYGTWTIVEKGGVLLTLNIFDMSKGVSTSFSATGSIEYAVQSLAKSVFDHYQKMQYDGWKNPQPSKQWIPPSRTMLLATAEAARMYCRGQDARLPYARELIMAMQGGEFHEGGIPVFKLGQIWAVADQKEYAEQYYYFVDQEKSSGGAIRTDAGYGTITGNYWCVRGEPSENVKFFENLYAVKRKFVAANNDTGVSAVNTILKTTGEIDMYTPTLYPTLESLDAALVALKNLGVAVKIPKSLLK